jgi:hypothetical protein
MVGIFTGIARLQDKFYKSLSAFISRFVIGQKLLASFKKLQLYRVLSSTDRISSLDIFRAVALWNAGGRSLFCHFRTPGRRFAD